MSSKNIKQLKDDPTDDDILAVLDKESKEFDKVRLISWMMQNVRASDRVRTLKSTASSILSNSMPTPSSTCNPVSQTATSRNAIA